jgi:hypothetical protein
MCPELDYFHDLLSGLTQNLRPLSRPGFFICLLVQAKLAPLPNKKPPHYRAEALCPELDSNQHTSRRRHLKTVRLPISPSGHSPAGLQIYWIGADYKKIFCFNFRLTA